jgi:hypothetical protein
MIRPENIPRRQRWLEPQANLMNLGVSFPSSSIQEFYQYGGTGGFGTPFVAPFLGYAHNFPSSGSHSSSYSHVKESVVKKETPVVKKEVKKTEAEIYDETAFTKDYDSNVKGKSEIEIYNETAFSSELSRSKQSRLSKIERDFVNSTDDKVLKELVKKGDIAEKLGDWKIEKDMHRDAQERILKKHGKKFNYNDESRKAYAYNSLMIHNNIFLDKIKEMNLILEDIFFYDSEYKKYFIKDKFMEYFMKIDYIYPESELIYSNRTKLYKR